MKELSLCFSKGSYESFARREVAAGFQEFKKKVFARDHNKCLFVGLELQSTCG